MNAPNFEDLFPLVDSMKFLNDMQNLKRHDRLSDFIPKLSEFVSCNCVTSSMLDGKFYSDFQLCNLAEYWPVPISMFAFSHFDFLALGWTIPRRFEVDLERYSVNM